jgi:hypothetical protein
MSGFARRDVLAGVLGASSVSGGSARAETTPANSLTTAFGRALATAVDAVAAFAQLGVFETLAAAQAATIPAGTLTVKTRWYAEPLDFGGATWRRAETPSAAPGRRRFADGTWWELAEVNPITSGTGAGGAIRRSATTRSSRSPSSSSGQSDRKAL